MQMRGLSVGSKQIVAGVGKVVLFSKYAARHKKGRYGVTKILVSRNDDRKITAEHSQCIPS